MWNYEEYFHSYALTHFMKQCGIEVESATDRAAEVRSGARFKAKFEDFAQSLIAKSMPKNFVALWMFWGSLQELLTTQAYEELATTTQNPVLAELCKRIARQERRHFAYYFGQARKKLEGQRGAQLLVRWIAKNFYAPVGGGVKTDAEGARLVAQLFPGERIYEVMSYIQKRWRCSPGWKGSTAAPAGRPACSRCCRPTRAS